MKFMSIIDKPTTRSSLFELQPGSTWSSFEQFRLAGAKALEPLHQGLVGTLHTKSGQYRILSEQDFQKLLGLARDVDRLRGGLSLVLTAAQAVKVHRDQATIETLINAVCFLGNSPALPTRNGFDPLLPEPEEVDPIDPSDEVELDPSQVDRPFS